MENNDSEVRLKITPKFNFIYELGMPTGRKIRTSLVVCIIFIIAYLLLINNQSLVKDLEVMKIASFNINKFLNIFAILAICFTFIRTILCTVIQILSYKNTTYTFYDKHMLYEDDFLNQHKKNILYENVKEVEIRRTIWDRILGFGIIVIYTSAENSKKNGLVIYGVKNVREVYDKIEELIHKSKENANVKNVENVDNKEEKKDDEGENFIKNMTNQVK